ncbi:hypothetical protein [Halorubrum depositum]|nr:hypothetical protein [Halorubrum depositum]
MDRYVLHGRETQANVRVSGASVLVSGASAGEVAARDAGVER